METILLLLVIVLIAAVAGLGVAFYNQLRKTTELASKKPALGEEEALLMADSKAKARILEAENQALEIQAKSQSEAQKIANTLKEREAQIDTRERTLLDRSKTLDQRFEQIETQEKNLEQAKRDVKRMREQVATKLEAIAQMTKAEAETSLKEEVTRDLTDWTAKHIKEAEFQIKREADDRARNILIDTMQKSATDYVAETTATTIDIPDEALKGKIIGKEGRNIRAFERLTGVDIIVDEAPNQVTVSCFDPIRREVAALALQKLLKDGRVHPTAIEESVRNVKRDLLKEIRRTGEKILYDIGINDLPDDIIMYLGRFKYRFSYGQNLVKHSLEMVNIGVQLAAELGGTGIDIRLLKKALLLHDIGKVLTHEYEGKPHHHISGDIVRKYLKDEKLANAVESHHDDIEPKSIEALIVKIADQISGARPGARRDSYDEYIKRVSALEEIAKQYPNVKEAFAVQAGREVRVIVKPESTSDEDTQVLAHKIAKEIEGTQSYPGTVKVTVIRELRVVEEAK
jgi:ribonucrease Y